MLPGVSRLFKPELGCLKDFELEVKLKPEASPIFCKPMNCSFEILEDLNDAYTRMESGKECGSPLTSMPMEPHWFQCERQSVQDKSRPESGTVGLLGNH